MREQAPEKQARLEAELQAELHGTRSLTVNRGTARLAKIAVVYFVVPSATGGSQQEVGAVEHVKCRRIELQGEPLRQLKVLGERQVRRPEIRTDKRVAPQVAKTAEAWIGQRWQVRLGEGTAR